MKTYYQDHAGLWANELRGWMPSTVFDSHVHIGPPNAIGTISADRLKEPLCTFTELDWTNALDVYSHLYSGIKIVGLAAFGFPLREANLEFANNYIATIMQSNPQIKGFLISDSRNTKTTIVQFLKALRKKVRFRGVKPYYDLLGKSNYKTTMPEFIPKDLLDFMNAEELVLMLHSSGTGMGDIANQNFVRSILNYYPHIKIILAHMGRYLTLDHFYDFMSSDIMDFPNIFLEISSASRPEVYTRVLENKSLWNKLVFGSDIPYGLITGEEYWSTETGPVFITRNEYAWSDRIINEKFADRRRFLTYNTYHTIHALKTAIDSLRLSQSEVTQLKNNIFLNNALLRVFGSLK